MLKSLKTEWDYKYFFDRLLQLLFLYFNPEILLDEKADNLV
jgi:hypothetical protein